MPDAQTASRCGAVPSHSLERLQDSRLGFLRVRQDLDAELSYLVIHAQNRMQRACRSAEDSPQSAKKKSAKNKYTECLFGVGRRFRGGSRRRSWLLERLPCLVLCLALWSLGYHLKYCINEGRDNPGEDERDEHARHRKGGLNTEIEAQKPGYPIGQYTAARIARK